MFNKTEYTEAHPSEWKTEIAYSINKENGSRNEQGKCKGLKLVISFRKDTIWHLGWKVSRLSSHKILPVFRENL
jgi:hypothetical protein